MGGQWAIDIINQVARCPLPVARCPKMIPEFGRGKISSLRVEVANGSIGRVEASRPAARG